MMPIKNFILIITILLLQKPIILAQTDSLNVYEIIEGDSMKMYFNKNLFLVEKECCKYTRYTKFSEEGVFYGYFEDINENNKLLGRGYYNNKGQKDGYFEIFYSNGQTQNKGFYKNDKPSGEWEYFYENGMPEKTVIITDKDTLLKTFYDKKGKLKIFEGNGMFKGIVSAYYGYSTTPIYAKGEIKNGKPNGKWTSTFGDMDFCIEEFDSGKLVKGIFPNITIKTNKEYSNKSFLNNFFGKNYFEQIEQLTFQDCKFSNNETTNKYKFDYNKFESDLSNRITQLVTSRLNSNVGDKYVSIQFKIDDEGKPYSFNIITPFGQSFVDAISISIANFTKFDPSYKIMYLHLKFEFSDGQTYGWSYYFSPEPTYD